MKRTSKKLKAQRRRDRLWKHWLRWLGKPPYWSEFREYKDYDANAFRQAFEKYQTHGRSKLSDDEWIGIQPLINGQNQKEFVITGVCEECLEFWSEGLGWLAPLRHSIACEPDRLTKVAFLRIERSIKEKGAEVFLLNHPKISQKKKDIARYKKFGS